ncbi:class A beta-lactamase [Piscinibacter sakaiensis]|uniref:Beta-lactamase n=1 Tax=Piscinibacter sakaiensis TaxID=1547922 RepID=A0A0K8P1S2_PISS1|nr:class A beta-lactamase [Piscinibacter sakaiensis]GAP36120.1 beta-lactamase [Piscinibacter sakaiensis]
MKRRTFAATAAAAALGGLGRAAGAATGRAEPLKSSAMPPLAEAAGWAGLEAAAGGRLGVAVAGPSGPLDGHRLDERFPMCSTFKWLVAARVLQRVDAGEERLARRLPVTARDLVAHSPVCERHVGATLSLAELCHATITTSDNAAANLLLPALGGPEGLTRWLRTLGDLVTRLDRWEPHLNEAAPDDPRDTTTPRAMLGLLRTLLLGDVLAPGSRATLAGWLEATETNTTRLRAAVPPGWRMGSKTGAGANGATNDVGLYWPPGRPTILVAAFLVGTSAPTARRHAAIAEVGRRAVAVG